MTPRDNYCADRGLTGEQAYPRFRRVKDAFRFVRNRALVSSEAMERTKAAKVAQTYGIETELVKRMKAKFRNELSFSGSGK